MAHHYVVEGSNCVAEKGEWTLGWTGTTAIVIRQELKQNQKDETPEREGRRPATQPMFAKSTKGWG